MNVVFCVYIVVVIILLLLGLKGLCKVSLRHGVNLGLTRSISHKLDRKVGAAPLHHSIVTSQSRSASGTLALIRATDLPRDSHGFATCGPTNFEG